MLLAAAVPDGFRGLVADLGAGAGAAGFAVATRCPDSRVVLVENDLEMADCAGRSLRLAQNARIADRISLLVADVRLAGNARITAGLADGRFDFVIANPPFNDPRDRPSPDPLRRGAHVMGEGEIGGWMRTAAAILRPGGAMALIARPSQLPALLDEIGHRFGAVKLKAVHARADGEAIRIVLRGIRGSRAPFALCPPIVLHQAAGRDFTIEAEALINGEATLFGDVAS